MSTVDLRKTQEDKVKEGEGYQNHMVGSWPYETSVYSLVNINEPLSSSEELFGDAINVNSLYRRDLVAGDLYLSRSRTAEAAALEHDKVVCEIQHGALLLLTQDERMAVYGAGETF